jgi:hypothetical protein
MILGDLLAYFIGRFVEYEWGSFASLVVFLALYFVSLWVAWLLSVWATEPKRRQPDPSGNPRSSLTLSPGVLAIADEVIE